MLGLVGAAAGGGLSSGTSSADTTAQTTSVFTDINQGNISFGGFDDDAAKWVAGAIVVAAAIYFLSRKR